MCVCLCVCTGAKSGAFVCLCVASGCASGVLYAFFFLGFLLGLEECQNWGTSYVEIFVGGRGIAAKAHPKCRHAWLLKCTKLRP